MSHEEEEHAGSSQPDRDRSAGVEGDNARPTADPEAAGKPETPVQLTKPSWKYIARTTFRELSDDQCLDLAAALTYYVDVLR